MSKILGFSTEALILVTLLLGAFCWWDTDSTDKKVCEELKNQQDCLAFKATGELPDYYFKERRGTIKK